MTARGYYTLLFGAILMITALSVGSAGAFLLGAGALAAFFLALASVLLAFFTCDIHRTESRRTCIDRLKKCSVQLFKKRHTFERIVVFEYKKQNRAQ